MAYHEPMKLVLAGLIAISTTSPSMAQQTFDLTLAPSSVTLDVSRDRLEKDVQALVACGTRHCLSETDSPTRGVGAARSYLQTQFEKAALESEGRMKVIVDRFQRTFGRRDPREGTFVNIIAHIAGSDPSRPVWVFGGHYDSINSDRMDGEGDAPGADDDASGTAVILEMARVLAGVPLEADVYLCAFDGEELGLFGSDRFAEKLKSDGVAVAGMVTNDIVGASVGPDGVKRDYIRCFSRAVEEGTEIDRNFRNYGAATEGASRQIARFAEYLGRKDESLATVKLIYRQDRFGRGGDHISFNNRGFPGIRFTEAAENYRHQHQNVREVDGVRYGDLIEFMDFEYLTRVARLNAAIAAHCAGAPKRPERLRIRGAVRHDVTLQWTKVEHENLGHYLVLRRETSSPTWQDSMIVPAHEQSWTFRNTSIDDHHFAVASVTKEGRISLPRFAYPPPPRRPHNR